MHPIQGQEAAEDAELNVHQVFDSRFQHLNHNQNELGSPSLQSSDAPNYLRSTKNEKAGEDVEDESDDDRWWW